MPQVGNLKCHFFKNKNRKGGKKNDKENAEIDNGDTGGSGGASARGCEAGRGQGNASSGPNLWMDDNGYVLEIRL